MHDLTEIESLRAEVAELRAALACTAAGEQPRSSRRQMLRLMGGVATGAAAAAVVGVGQAAAIDGLTITASSATSTANQVMVTSTNASSGNKFLFRGGGSTATNTTGGFSSVIAVNAAGTVDGLTSRTTDGMAGRFRSDNNTGLQVTGTSSLELFAQGDGLGSHHIVFATPLTTAYTKTSQSYALDSCVDGLWFNVGGGANWRKLAGLETAGSLHPIATARVYDSRKTMTPMANGILATGANRVIDVSDKRDTSTGAVILADVVPEHATAVAYNLTIVSTVGTNGFLSVEPGGAAVAGGSAINWSAAGLTLANASIAQLNASRQLRVFCGGTATSCHFIIDIVGYYL